jgi:hypothetical protein
MPLDFILANSTAKIGLQIAEESQFQSPSHASQALVSAVSEKYSQKRLHILALLFKFKFKFKKK